MACILTLAFGAYMFAVTLIKDTLEDLKSFNKNLKKSTPDLDISKKFSEIVHVHSVGIELSVEICL